MEEMNIFQKMSAISDKISKVAKNLTVGTGKSAYKAVGESDVLSAVKPIEREFGVYSYPIKRTILETNVLTTTSEYEGKVTEKNQLFMRIETVYRFVNIDKPEEFIDITTYGDGVDSQDKACGKAMTYADKYALLKAYKIETGDDPDQHKSEDLKSVGSQPAGKKASPKQVEILSKNYTGDNLKKLLEANGIDKIEDITMTKASELISKIYGKGDKKE